MSNHSYSECEINAIQRAISERRDMRRWPTDAGPTPTAY